MKVGDYVRLKDGGIRKITDIEPVEDGINNYYVDETYVNRFNQECNCMTKKCIKGKPKKELIDLIEYGDIIKYKIDDEEFISEVWGDKNNYFVQEFDIPEDLRNLNIVSIVTHEQFSQMEYRIGG